MKIGDIVRLCHGGPTMTITLLDVYNATCSWFTTNNELVEHKFPINSLASIFADPKILEKHDKMSQETTNKITIKTISTGIGDATGSGIYVQNGFFDANQNPITVLINKTIVIEET